MTVQFRGSMRDMSVAIGAGFRRASIAVLPALALIAASPASAQEPASQGGSLDRISPVPQPEANQPPAGSQAPATMPAGDAAATDDTPPARAGAGLETGESILASSGPTDEPSMDDVNRYLWAVYQRTPVKRDSTGDFTWKDVAAAERLGMSLGDYVIGGMDPDFRELLYRAGRAMDAAGIRWTILSGFRDDYRQGLASGFKAQVDNSLHGGSLATGGYRHGCAADITDPDHHSEALWKWIDANSAQIGLQRLLPGVDPGHVQPRGAWHALAFAVRNDRLASDMAPGDNDMQPGDVAAPAQPADVNAVPPSAVDSLCIFLRHRPDEGVQAGAPEHQGFKIAARTPAKPGNTKAGWRSRAGMRVAALSRSSRDRKSVHNVEDARPVEAARSAAHGKVPAHSLLRPTAGPRHALHAVPRNAARTT